MHPKTKLCSAVTLSVFVIANANAHIVLQKKSAPRASQYTAAFEVGHGCAGQATTELIVTLPAGVRLDNERISNERVSKTGWQLDTTKTGQVRWHSGLTAPTATDEFLVDVVFGVATKFLRRWVAQRARRAHMHRR